MMRLAIALMSAALTLAAVPGAAQSACQNVTVHPAIAVAGEELSLADLLAKDSCGPLREAAERVGLGAAPRAGGVRVFEGGEIRRRIQELSREVMGNELAARIPERIVVRRAAAMKLCAAIADFVARASSAPEMARAAGRERDQEPAMDCAAARSVPEEAALELTKSSWNASLQRWEFALRCTRVEECIPFLVWRNEENKVAAGIRSASARLGRARDLLALPVRVAQPNRGDLAGLVKAGQTATLSWDAGGIRIVLPVTCLDAGAAGEMVRVRFKNTARILRAEVLGDGTLRASL